MTKRNSELAYGVAGAAFLIALPLAVIAAKAIGLVDESDSALAPRLFGIATGLILAAYGNIAPRQLVRYDADSDRPARKQAIIRFSGWIFTLAGLGYALIWLVAPPGKAATLSMIPVIAGLALVGLRIARAKASKTGTAPR